MLVRRFLPAICCISHHNFANTTASTYDSDDAFLYFIFFLSFHFFILYFFVFFKRCCNLANLFLKISSYLDCMPQRSSFCCLFLFLFCFLLLTNFLFYYIFYGGTEIKDTDIDTDQKVAGLNKSNSEGPVNSLTSPSSLFSTHTAACHGSLVNSSLEVCVNGTKLTALVDSGKLYQL